MDDTLDSFENQIKELEKALKGKSAKTVSDEKTRGLLANLTKKWHGQLKPIIDKWLPGSDELYNLDNTVDRLVEYTTKPAKKEEVLKDTRAFLRGYRKHVRLNLLKHASVPASTDRNQILVDPARFDNLRKYLSEAIRQINITYAQLCPDACALLLRKLSEFMLYDYYQIKGRESDIVDAQGQTKHLKTIINQFIDHSGERPGEVLKNFLKDVRVFGGTAAHNKRINLQQVDIDRLAATATLALVELHSIVYSAK